MNHFLASTGAGSGGKGSILRGLGLRHPHFSILFPLEKTCPPNSLYLATALLGVFRHIRLVNSREI